MSDQLDDPASIWENLLSRDPGLVMAIFSQLDAEARQQVLRHLKRMAEEPGWHEEQARSASFALDVITRQANDDHEAVSLG